MVSYKIDFKMHLLKQTMNYIAPRILRLSSGVQPKTPQSQLITRIWLRLEDTLRKEVETAVFNDRNFSKLLESSKQALVFLCEQDKYYKRWLGLLALFLSEEVEKERQAFTYEKALECSARPLALTREEFESHKTSLFELYLTGYLYGLSLMPQEDINKIKKARDNKGAVDFPSRDTQAFFRLVFPEREQPHDKEERKN